MIFQPTFMDILPQYVVYMLAAPLVVWACVRGRWAQIAAGSFIVWLGAQFGVHGPHDGLERVAYPAWRTRRAGQLQPYGLAGGLLRRRGVGRADGLRARALDQVFTLQRSWVAKAALAICLVLLPLRVLTTYNLAPRTVLDFDQPVRQSHRLRAGLSAIRRRGDWLQLADDRRPEVSARLGPAPLGGASRAVPDPFPAPAPGGVMVMLMMPLVGFLVTRVDPRWMIIYGFTISSTALFAMLDLNTGVSYNHVAMLRVFQAAGLAFLFIPINTLSYTGIPGNKNNDVSGLTNLARNIGGSMGTAFFVTILARRQQFHQERLATSVAFTSLNLQDRLNSLTATLPRTPAPSIQSARDALLPRQTSTAS